jgi:hypothetical protein
LQAVASVAAVHILGAWSERLALWRLLRFGFVQSGLKSHLRVRVKVGMEV